MIENVSNRIKRLVSLIKYKKIADIGTDHGYIPIWACLEDTKRVALGCDIAKAPLENARRNITNHRLTDKIELRLGDGISKLKEGEAQTIIIAGMGGKTIRGILESGAEILKGTSQLILSPQSGVPNVRRCVHGLGYAIKDELFLEEDGRFYHILDCRKSSENEVYSEVEYELGKHLIAKNNDIYKSYLQDQIEKLEKILKNMDKMLDRANEISEQIDLYKLYC